MEKRVPTGKVGRILDGYRKGASIGMLNGDSNEKLICVGLFTSYPFWCASHCEK